MDRIHLVAVSCENASVVHGLSKRREFFDSSLLKKASHPYILSTHTALNVNYVFPGC